MAFAPLAADPDVERRLHRRRFARRIFVVLAAALVIVAALHTWRTVSDHGRGAHVATKTVTLIEATPASDGVHVRARLDAPSPNGTSHELRGVIPASTWAQTKVLWACYPPSDPDKGELRTPLDPDCVDFIAARD